MGVLTMEMKEINKNMVDMQKRQKQIEEITQKREQEKNQKQYEKDILYSCKNDLKNSMDRVFESCVKNSTKEYKLNAVLQQYYNVDTRNACINEFGKTTREKDYLDEVYDKVLKQVYNKWKNQIEFNKTKDFSERNNETIANLQQLRKDEKFVRNVNVFFAIIKWILIVLFLPIVLLFMFVSMCAKDNK